MQLADETLSQLWIRARASFARIIAAHGAPAVVAALIGLAHTQRREIGAWLTSLESSIRKLLFAEASRLPIEPHHNSPHKPPPPAQTRASNSTSPRPFDASRPESWPARFTFAPPRDPRAVPEAQAPRIRALWGDTHAPQAAEAITPRPGMRVCHPTTKHLACRFEAIRRVLADPMPYARRLARIFHRLRRRFPEAPRRFAISAPRAYVYDPEDSRLRPDAMSVAIEGLYAFDSS